MELEIVGLLGLLELLLEKLKLIGLLEYVRDSTPKGHQWREPGRGEEEEEGGS